MFGINSRVPTSNKNNSNEDQAIRIINEPKLMETTSDDTELVVNESVDMKDSKEMENAEEQCPVGEVQLKLAKKRQRPPKFSCMKSRRKRMRRIRIRKFLKFLNSTTNTSSSESESETEDEGENEIEIKLEEKPEEIMVEEEITPTPTPTLLTPSSILELENEIQNSCPTINNNNNNNINNNNQEQFRERQLSVSDSEDSFIVFGNEDEVDFINSTISDADEDSEDDDSDDRNTCHESSNDETDTETNSEHTCIIFDINRQSFVNCLKKQNKHKKVRFATDDKLCEIHPMIKWSFAYQKARKGPWEACARDRDRFKRRVNDIENILQPILNNQHRDKIYQERFNQKIFKEKQI